MNYFEGSIFFDKTKNRYCFKFYQNGKTFIKRFKTQTEAKKYKAQINAVRLKGDFIQPTKMSVGEWLIEWLETYVKNQVKETTYKRYLITIKNLEPIANCYLADIKPPQIQKLYNEHQNTLSASSIIKIHRLLFTAFKKAKQLSMIDNNIMLDIDTPRAEKKEIEIFTDAEIKQIFTNLKSNYPKYYPIFYMLLMTGIRIGEALALKWSDLNFSKGLIKIQRNKLNLAGEVYSEPKTAAGRREIPLPQQLLQILKEKRTSSKVEAINGLIFHTANRKPYNHANIDKIWKKTTSKNIHLLRHTYATKMLAEGVPILELARCLGHSTPSHTLNLYGHHIQNFNEIIKQKANKLFKF